jgi:DNA-directed RNA polymerase III subunit RPC7
MSRGGGRGGFGRGRGGPGGGPFGNDDLKPDYSVTELFPPQPQPVQSVLTKEERARVQRWRGQREKVHNGPMYTVMARKRGMEDPFNDVKRYSEKYRKVERRAPKLDSRPYGGFPSLSPHSVFPHGNVTRGSRCPASSPSG